MYNWSVDEKKLKKHKEQYIIWKIEQLINYGLISGFLKITKFKILVLCWGIILLLVASCGKNEIKKEEEFSGTEQETNITFQTPKQEIQLEEPLVEKEAKKKSPHPSDWLKKHIKEKEELCKMCHNEKPCSSCHKGVKPSSHKNNWLNLHYTKRKSINCYVCHSKQSCFNCHKVEMPHSSNWKVIHMKKGRNKNICSRCHKFSFCFNCHKIEMPHLSNWIIVHKEKAKNKNICQRCHKESFCSKCHKKNKPLSHTTYWLTLHKEKAKADKSKCVICHKESFCFNCHKIEMPHPSDWVTKHKEVVADKGKNFCLSHHKEDFCSKCH